MASVCSDDSSVLLYQPTVAPSSAGSDAGAMSRCDDEPQPECELETPQLTAPVRSKAERKRQFALQFKTQGCRAFLADGLCPYAAKCYFAHGDDDFRTPEQNDADGLITDAAIRAWLRARAAAASDAPSGGVPSAAPTAAVPASRASPALDESSNAASVKHDEPTPFVRSSSVPPANTSISNEVLLTSASFGSTPSSFDDSSEMDSVNRRVRPPTAVVPRFRYNPYSVYRVKVSITPPMH